MTQDKAQPITGKKVVLFGTGDFARVASVYLAKDSPYDVVAFTVHEAFLKQPDLLGKPVAPFERLEELYPPDRYAMFVAIGFSRINKARAEIYDACKAKGYELISYINSKAVHWGEITYGDNCFVFENNVLQPFVRLGNDVILWSGNHVGHDATIGDHCFITSHTVISGNVQVGPYCFIGVNATLRDGVKIGAESVIGAGALVLQDLPPMAVCKGTAAEVSRVPSNRLKGL
jgi:sugar O-acyltransferase (sialic acid O-acetyltransferase NeuD family)